MPRGGARNRSGPQADPKSLRSAERGISLTALPSEGYDGEPPEFPLPGVTDRESEVWAEVWTTPQACAWALEPWRWRKVALWVRWSVRMEAEDASAALGNVVVRFEDQIGLTPAGLKENGWAIARDETASKRTEKATPPKKASARDRFQVVSGGE